MDLVRAAILGVVAFALLSSGLIHASDPYFFLATVSSYRILPDGLLGRPLLLVPYLHIALGICLLSGVARTTALRVSLLLFVVYAAAQTIALVRGEKISCGCFGFDTGEIGPASVAVPVAAGAACLGLLFLFRQPDACYNESAAIGVSGRGSAEESARPAGTRHA